MSANDMKKIISFSLIISSLLCLLLLYSFAPICKSKKMFLETITLCASIEIPELGISKGEYYDVVIRGNGKTVIFQNLTNSITCKREGGMGHLDMSKASYTTSYIINDKYRKDIEFWFPDNHVSNSIPENPRQVMIHWGNGKNCYFR